jgi:hypothetical protein
LVVAWVCWRAEQGAGFLLGQEQDLLRGVTMLLVLAVALALVLVLV